MSSSKLLRRAIRFGLISGVVSGLLVKRWLTTGQPMPHLQVWERALVERGRDEKDAERLAEKVEAHYVSLVADRPRLSHAVLNLHMMLILLPGLALYQVMLGETDNVELALQETEALLVATFGRFRRVIALLDVLPGRFDVFRNITRRTLQIGFPHAGWEISPVEDSEECIAFDYTRCLYQEMLVAYGAPELAPQFCRLDDLLYQALPAEITWRRTQTMADGASHCDFRWCWDEGMTPMET